MYCWNFLGNRLGINSSTSSWWFCSPVAVVPAGVRRRNCVGYSWCRIRFNVSGSCSRSTLWCIVFNVNRLSRPFVLLRVWMNSVSNIIICCLLCWCYELYTAIHSCGGIRELLLLKLLTNFVWRFSSKWLSVLLIHCCSSACAFCCMLIYVPLQRLDGRQRIQVSVSKF